MYRWLAIGLSITLALISTSWTLVSAQARLVKIVSPAEGEVIAGPNVTFTVQATGVKLPDEHFHLFIDDAAIRYVLGNPVPTGQVDFVHFRALTTTVRLTPGPHVAVLVPGDANHVPFRPWVSDTVYFFVR